MSEKMQRELLFDAAERIIAIPRGKKSVAPLKQRSMTEGLTPERWRPREGVMTLTPAMAAAVYIERLELNGELSGYQRDVVTSHVREIARAMEAGKPFPLVELAIDEEGLPIVVDGQHRLMAAILVRRNIKVAISKMTYKERRDLFEGQRRARKVNAANIILSASGPFDKYVQAAVVANGERDSSHPWAEFASFDGSWGKFLTPNQMHRDIMAFCLGWRGETSVRKVRQDTIEAAYDESMCDLLGWLLRSLGTRETNKVAFESGMRGALIPMAHLAVASREGDVRERARERWADRMQVFPFSDWRGERNTTIVIGHMVRWWNYKCPKSLRVEDR